MKTLIRAAALGALLASGAVAAHAQQTAPVPAAESMFRASTLNLAAYGEVRVPPDMATITIGVMTEGKTAQEAMRANATRMNQVMSQLRAQGIAERDIQTSNLSLSPQYRYQENQPPELVGYQASNNVTIRVMDLARLGQALDAAVGVGANQIHGISFGLRDPDAAENEARRRAVRALTAKADLYASATNLRVLRLVNLSEGGGYQAAPPMPVMQMARAEMAKDATSVSGGELVVRIDIAGIYELVR